MPTQARDEPSPTALELVGIARRFGRRWALRGIDLRIGAGEAVALVGRNGSGKTTLLRVISTLLRPNRGGGRIWGFDLVREAEAIRSRVGLLGHSTGLYEDLTAAENLRFAARMAGIPADDGAIRTVLGSVGLARDGNRRVRTFSAGMRRRLALGRLVLSPPALLLLDEPFTSFDPEGVADLSEFVRSVREADGTVVVATHDLERASRMVDRFVRLDAGVVVDDAPAEPAWPLARAGERGRA